jgi:hypothetical protein
MIRVEFEVESSQPRAPRRPLRQARSLYFDDDRYSFNGSLQ